MAKEAVAQLFRAASLDIALREKLSLAANLETFIAMAKAHGYEFTEEEWREMTGFSVEELKSHVSEIPGI